MRIINLLRSIFGRGNETKRHEETMKNIAMLIAATAALSVDIQTIKGTVQAVKQRVDELPKGNPEDDAVIESATSQVQAASLELKTISSQLEEIAKPATPPADPPVTPPADPAPGTDTATS